MSIPDDFPGFNKDLFCLPDKYKDSVSHVLISHGMVQVRFELFLFLKNTFHSWDIKGAQHSQDSKREKKKKICKNKFK